MEFNSDILQECKELIIICTISGFSLGVFFTFLKNGINSLLAIFDIEK